MSLGQHQQLYGTVTGEVQSGSDFKVPTLRISLNETAGSNPKIS